MKKTLCTIIAVVTIATITAWTALATGCGKQPLSEDVRLKKDIVIDGLNVSTMTVAEARAALEEVAAARLSEKTLTLALPNVRTAFTPATLGGRYDIQSALEQAVALGARGGDRRITMQFTIDETELSSVLDSYIQQSQRSARDASYAVDMSLATPVVYSPEQTGISIDGEALKESVRQALSAQQSTEIAVPCQTIVPAITLDSIQQQNALVSQYSTSFSGSSHSKPNRVFNMDKAANSINGTVLMPGETFDCNAVIGDRVAENGWKMAPAIRNGRYEDEYGGGVCQISSTLFNAVLMADLNITERHPHSWPMGYVDIGRDATISTGGKNFCFVNSSGAPLTIYMHVDPDAKTVTASIYGKPLPNGQTIDVVSEKTDVTETAGEILMLDESLPSNTRFVEREARDGKSSVTYKAYRDSAGTLLYRTLAYEDTYKAIDGITYVSTDLYYAANPGESEGAIESTPLPEETPDDDSPADMEDPVAPIETPPPAEIETPTPEQTENGDDVPAEN